MQLPASLVTFRPRLIDALRGYNRERFTTDLGAGVTVGIVALPLAMAFAIASGLKPDGGVRPDGGGAGRPVAGLRPVHPAQPAEVLRRSGFMAELQAHEASPEVSV